MPVAYGFDARINNLLTHGILLYAMPRQPLIPSLFEGAPHQKNQFLSWRFLSTQ